jgi:Ribbon-helix-helix protein, copG family
MAATRTQVYLTKEQRELIDQIAESEGLTMAEVVRRALEAYLVRAADPTGALQETFGAAPDLDVPSRDEWDRG